MVVDRSRRWWVLITMGLFLIWPLLFVGCGTKCTEIETCIDVASFQAAARDVRCAELRNALFMIDRQLVFWDREGNCADARFHRALYGCTLDEPLCRNRDTVAGWRWEYADSSYRELFETIVANRLRRDLGLGPYHEVLAIQF